MGLKKWKIKCTDLEKAKDLAQESGINSFVALLAINRGISEPYELDMFLSDSLELDNPFTITDMEKGVERINASLTLGEKIAIYGDYDCDGVTATAVMYSYLKSKGADVLYYIPDRIIEGYGMNKEAVKKLYELGVELIVTVDNGISAIEEIEYAKSLGIDVVVTDHHLPSSSIPDAAAVIDPHRIDDTSGAQNLCGVGVAFKVICALENEKAPEELLLEYAPLLTIGTIGDVVPLVGENRAYCKCGIDIINNSAPVGIAALKTVAGVDNKPLNASSISFALAPRINAAGRMGSSMRAVELLLTKSSDRAAELATELDCDNQNRQRLCEDIFSEATNIIESNKLMHNRIILVAGNNWHLGVIGIVASKIVEKYGKPCILFGGDQEFLHGSGRSIEGFNLYNAIDYAKKYAEYFGGHELAAGVTLRAENFDNFYYELLNYAEGLEQTYSKIELDCKLRPEIIGPELALELRQFEPYGAGNPVPLFGLYGVTVNSITPLKGGKYVRLGVQKNGRNFTVLCFMYSEQTLPVVKGSLIDIAFNLEYNEYMGKGQATLIAKQLRPHGIVEEEYFSSLADSELLLGDRIPNNPKALYPTRDEFSAVFRYLKLSMNTPVERVMFKFHLMGAGKVTVILNAFLSVGLVSENNGIYSLLPAHGRVDLEEASIIKKLSNYIKVGEG